MAKLLARRLSAAAEKGDVLGFEKLIGDALEKHGREAIKSVGDPQTGAGAKLFYRLSAGSLDPNAGKCPPGAGAVIAGLAAATNTTHETLKFLLDHYDGFFNTPEGRALLSRLSSGPHGLNEENRKARFLIFGWLRQYWPFVPPFCFWKRQALCNLWELMTGEKVELNTFDSFKNKQYHLQSAVIVVDSVKKANGTFPFRIGWAGSSKR